MNFTQTLFAWYAKNKRNLPWRNTNDAYKIWLSEIILQQTRVEQGTPYYHRFIEQYPDLASLASADENEVLKLWQGLGYYSRARNLLFAAKQMLAQFGGFPKSYEQLIAMKGIGDYTASAISSIAFKEPHAVVDGNVYRFLSRYFGIETAIDSTAGTKEFKNLAQQLLDKRKPGIFNQSMMEFGALQCKPANPICIDCPFNQTCYALLNKVINQLPVKEKKIKVRTRYFNYLVLHHGTKVFIRQRTQKDIWKGLFEFPLIETTGLKNIKGLMNDKHFIDLLHSSNIELLHQSESISHQLSHQLLITRFYHFKINKTQVRVLKEQFQSIGFNDLALHALPQLLVNYVKGKQ